MSNPERDTKFAGWAKALLTKIDNVIGTGYERIAHQELSEQEFANDLGTMIARAGYDLACHVSWQIGEAGASAMDCGLRTPQQVVNEMDDMPVLPEEEK